MENKQIDSALTTLFNSLKENNHIHDFKIELKENGGFRVGVQPKPVPEFFFVDLEK